MALSSAPAASADPNDADFLQVLDQDGIVYGSRSDGLAMGHSICIVMDEDNATTMEMVRVTSHNHALTNSDSAYVVGAAIASFCPWNRGK